jgi:hypothetical protein
VGVAWEQPLRHRFGQSGRFRRWGPFLRLRGV